MKKKSLTAYSKAESNCHQYLVHAEIDIDSFQRKIQSCSLENCHGICCYEGTFLTEEDADILQDVVKRESSFFENIGLELPEQFIIDYPHYEEHEMEKSEWLGISGRKSTALKPRNFSLIVEDYPKHFDDTACVFMTDLGQCGLQMLAETKGLHPWYYKPFLCWLHPISITPLTSDRVVIQMPSPENEPHQSETFLGFTTYTFCGKTQDCGQPAFEVLAKELNFLGEIADRNFAEEIKQNYRD